MLLSARSAPADGGRPQHREAVLGARQADDEPPGSAGEPPVVIVTPVPDDEPPPGTPPPPDPGYAPPEVPAPPPGTVQPPPGTPAPPAEPDASEGSAAEGDADESPLDWRRRHDRFFLGFHPTVFAPVGDWTEHRLAGVDLPEGGIPDGVSQFGFGGGASIEFGWLTDPILLILQTTIARLDLSDWEDAAAAAGTPVSAWAIWWDIAAMAVVEPVQSGVFALQLRAGLGVQYISAKETHESWDVSYDYPFTRPAADLRAGVGFSFGIHETADLVLSADFAAGLPGLDYPGERRQTAMMAFLVSFGVRLYPDAARGD
jgi:hypothetical protein